MRRYTAADGADLLAYAFLDLDGTLVRSNLVHIAAHHASRRTRIWARALNTAALVAGGPVLYATDKVSRSAFQELFFRSFVGIGIDRLRWLGEDAAQNVLEEHLREGTRDLLDRLREADLEPVVVTGNLAHVVGPFCERMGIRHFGSNRLEVRDEQTTGRLLEPVMSGAQKAAWIRDFCRRHGVSPDDCHAYTDAIADLPMLATVGHPCVVHPERSLALEARALQWPVLDLDRNAKGATVYSSVDHLISGVQSR